MDVGDGREVEVPPPDEVLHLAEEGRRLDGIAGHEARLDEGRPLPVLAHGLVVFDRRRHRHRHRRGRGIGAQAQVHAEHIALAGAVVEQGRHGLGQADGHRRHLGPVPERHVFGLVEDRDVDVAGVVEFVRPVLAEREDEIAGHGPALAVLDRQEAPPLDLLRRRRHQGRAHRRVGEAGQGGGHGVERPHPAQVAERGEQVQLRLQPAQAVAHSLSVGRLGFQGRCVLEDGAEPLVRIALQEGLEIVGPALGQSRQIGRGGEHRRQGRPGLVQHGAPAALRRRLGQGFVRPLRRARVHDRAARFQAVGERGGR